jgi:hypothetical protein
MKTEYPMSDEALMSAIERTVRETGRATPGSNVLKMLEEHLGVLLGLQRERALSVVVTFDNHLSLDSLPD